MEVSYLANTIQSASIVESYYIEKYLSEHPNATLKDVYSDESLINYRVIIMAPGHLVEKWAEELVKEIPFARPVILNDLSQLEELRGRGREERNGKEFFIIGKDFCKLDTQLSPIPVSMKRKYVSFSACADCYEEGRIVYRSGSGKKAFCPTCRGKRFMPIPQPHLGRAKGLICPCCGEVLLKNGAGFADKSDDSEFTLSDYVLTPGSFAVHKTENSTCYHCNAPLWGANVKPLVTVDCAEKKSKWYKVSHFANFSRKKTTTAYVLRNHEQDYLSKCTITEGLRTVEQAYGPRKVAPSRYIKKYLKGFFDVCILDECHKYAGSGTAQANAAQSIAKASKFVIGATGTISNGTAESFFYLFFMLAPRSMIRRGYTYSRESLMAFCRRYGCVETKFENASSRNQNVTYNTSSRGRQIGSPTVKPGISPTLFTDFLLDCCVYLDISDLSRFLPPLIEKVELVELPPDISWAYNSTLSCLREFVYSPEGAGAASNLLQVGLSYPDKPYGRNPIMSTSVDDFCLVNPKNFDEYSNVENLLPKEEKLISIVKQEISEGRNCFVYASFTGSDETNVAPRLKSLIEHYCNLQGRVEIIQSSSPAARKREEWFHKRASEGIKVFITNPKNVETGLDFCFWYKSVQYNYPTLIFYQVSYELAVMWQASRRSYRLNQTEECRNYYIAYEGTLQAAALEIMAKKQVATSAIQGKFSTEGLSAMAKGVDARTQLAAALASNDFSDRTSLTSMFDVLNAQNNDHSDDGYGEYIPPKTYYELIDLEPVKETPMASNIFSLEPCLDLFDMFTVNMPIKTGSTVGDNESANVSKASTENTLEDIFSVIFPTSTTPATSQGAKSSETKTTMQKKKKNDSPSVEQFSLFDFVKN